MVNVVMEIARVGASAFSLFMCMSPAPSLYKIHKNKHCGEVVVIPLLSLWGNCHLWTLYGYLTENLFPVFLTFITGEVFSWIYLIVYYRYTTERKYMRKFVIIQFLALLAVTIYALSGEYMLGITSQSKSTVGDVVGWIAVTVCVLLFASPLATIRRVIRTKNAASFPIALCVVGFVGNSLWVIYGSMIGDLFMWGSNAICVALGFVQIIVYIIYNPSKKVNQEHRELLEVDLEKKISVVISPRSNTSTDEADSGSNNDAQVFHAMQSPREPQPTY
uniref:Sugar transporter SWEET1 n=1 Tax=Globisporangium ultimum (strain ATCC 200006 / CBS 805.95 / DAOM BR144) TaxID=431595 RepID=K3WEY5_GLOUD